MPPPAPLPARVHLVGGDFLTYALTPAGQAAITSADFVFCNNFAGAWEKDSVGGAAGRGRGGGPGGRGGRGGGVRSPPTSPTKSPSKGVGSLSPSSSAAASSTAGSGSGRSAPFLSSVMRALVRLMRPGALLCSMSKFPGCRHDPTLWESLPGTDGSLYAQAFLYFGVCGGWDAGRLGDGPASLRGPRGLALLGSDAHDAEVEAVWVRGLARPQAAGLRFVLAARRAALLRHAGKERMFSGDGFVAIVARGGRVPSAGAGAASTVAAGAGAGSAPLLGGGAGPGSSSSAAAASSAGDAGGDADGDVGADGTAPTRGGRRNRRMTAIKTKLSSLPPEVYEALVAGVADAVVRGDSAGVGSKSGTGAASDDEGDGGEESNDATVDGSSGGDGSRGGLETRGGRPAAGKAAVAAGAGSSSSAALPQPLHPLLDPSAIRRDRDAALARLLRRGLRSLGYRPSAFGLGSPAQLAAEAKRAAAAESGGSSGGSSRGGWRGRGRGGRGGHRARAPSAASTDGESEAASSTAGRGAKRPRPASPPPAPPKPVTFSFPRPLGPPVRTFAVGEELFRRAHPECGTVRVLPWADDINPDREWDDRAGCWNTLVLNYTSGWEDVIAESALARNTGKRERRPPAALVPGGSATQPSSHGGGGGGKGAAQLAAELAAGRGKGAGGSGGGSK